MCVGRWWGQPRHCCCQTLASRASPKRASKGHAEYIEDRQAMHDVHNTQGDAGRRTKDQGPKEPPSHMARKAESSEQAGRVAFLLFWQRCQCPVDFSQAKEGCRLLGGGIPSIPSCLPGGGGGVCQGKVFPRFSGCFPVGGGRNETLVTRRRPVVGLLFTFHIRESFPPLGVMAESPGYAGRIYSPRARRNNVREKRTFYVCVHHKGISIIARYVPTPKRRHMQMSCCCCC